ncbi:MAG: hypothetical protein WKF50_05365 [Nocardioides sp.]
MDSPAVIIILLVTFAGLLALGSRGLREGLNDSVAFGAVCLSPATVLGCLLMLMLYAETV